MQLIKNKVKELIAAVMRRKPMSNKIKGQLITIVLFAVVLNSYSFHGADAIAVTLKIFGFGYNILTGMLTLIVMPHAIEWILNRKPKNTSEK
jgi:hypothetical protein